MNHLQIIFWKIARKNIYKGYIGDKGCDIYSVHCPKCRAEKMVKWIDEHLGLLEWERKQGKS